MPFRRILVPVDFTRKTARAVKTAARVAASSDAEATLLHVIERIDDGTPGALSSFYRKLEASARERLRPLAQEFEKKNVPVRAVVVYGQRVAEILRFAEKNRSDLIVMSSHRLPLKPPAENWGTISYKVGILARCPVLLVK
jgi:nucleotide-binding universal stress UspA family protein